MRNYRLKFHLPQYSVLATLFHAGIVSLEELLAVPATGKENNVARRVNTIFSAFIVILLFWILPSLHKKDLCNI